MNKITKRPSYTTFEGLQNVFTQPKSREEQVKNLISMDILKLCDEHKVNINIYYGIEIIITICSRTSDRRAARVLFREDLPDDDDLRSLYFSIVIKELIHLIEEDGIKVSGIAKTT